MIRKLRIKFIIVNMSIVLIMLSIIFSLVFYFTQSSLETESIQAMQSLLNQPFKPGPPPQQEQSFRLPYFILQIGTNGEIRPVHSGDYDLTDNEFVTLMAEAAVSSQRETGVISEYNLRFYRQSIPGKISLIFADISIERSILSGMINTCMAVGCLSFIAFLCISILLSKWAVHPVEQAFNQQRQFVADASHELKTPLTVILNCSELATNDEYSEHEKKQLLQNVHTMASHMKILVEQLLELSRTDKPACVSVKQTVNLSSIITNASLAFEAVLFEAEHPLTCKIESDLFVSGDEQQLTQVIEILLDNAGKYASEKGSIFVTLKKHGNGHCLLSVCNEGKRIPEDKLQHLFERFYRMDSARKRDGSFGLGLSIAENIIKSHKGKIWAESSEGMNSFFVLLPSR